MEHEKKGGFKSSLGFVLAAAGSAVGVGNLWRFPYLAAKDGGGLFILIYIILVVTFGFALLATDIAIGRKTGQSGINAYRMLHPKFGFVGKLTFVVPALIITYYMVITGWILKYIVVYFTGAGPDAAKDGYFSDFITAPVAPIIFTLIMLAITAFIVYCGVEKGIENFSKIIMPGLVVLIIIISVFSLTLKHTDADGVTRTGLQGLAVYLIPNFEGITFSKFMGILVDAMTQMFFSLSVAMGIMVTYGSYVKKDNNLTKSVLQISLFDTVVAILAGMMIIPAVYVFSGTEGMASGPSLLFVSLPKIFDTMGITGTFVGIAFFVMAAFAALTSCVSIMETLVGNCIEVFHISRKKACVIIGVLAAVGAVVICLGYNIFYFEFTLPNGSVGQILDIADFISNNLLMPVAAFFTSIIIGWIVKPKWIEDEMEASGHPFKMKKIYRIMIKYIAPAMMIVLLLQSFGAFSWFKK